MTDPTNHIRQRRHRERTKARITTLETALCAISTTAKTITEARDIAREALAKRHEQERT